MILVLKSIIAGLAISGAVIVLVLACKTHPLFALFITALVLQTFHGVTCKLTHARLTRGRHE